MNPEKWTMGSDIKKLSEYIRTHNVSPVEIVTACLRRIEELNPTLNAFVGMKT